jgi:uncharacterized protein (TIGR03067 family)
MRNLLLPAVLFAVLAPTATADDKADADLKAMVGKWTVVKAELGGKDVTEHLKDLDFQVRDKGAYTAKVGKMVDKGAFTVDPSKSPKHMDIKTGKDGPSAGKTIKAIYKIDGDSLTVCYEFGGEGDRPTEFKTKPDTKQYLAEYKRAK